MIVKLKNYLLVLYQYVQVVKLNEQMLSIIAMVLTLNPQVLEHVNITCTRTYQFLRLSDLCIFCSACGRGCELAAEGEVSGQDDAAAEGREEGV